MCSGKEGKVCFQANLLEFYIKEKNIYISKEMSLMKNLYIFYMRGTEFRFFKVSK